MIFHCYQFSSSMMGLSSSKTFKRIELTADGSLKVFLQTNLLVEDKDQAPPVPQISTNILYLNQVIFGRMSERQDAKVTLLIDAIALNVMRPGLDEFEQEFYFTDEVMS